MMGAMTHDPAALGAYLKARRTTRTPEAAGLPGGGRRRTPGLRREELAALAGLSIDYLTRLEQGRHPEPSAQVLSALADALGLTADGRRHLFGLGGRQDPGPRTVTAREVPEPLRRLVTRSDPHPAFVLNRRRDLLVWNTGAAFLFGLDARPPHEHNLVHLTFAEDARALWSDWPMVAQDTVAQLRAALAQTTADPGGDAFVDELSARSAEFAALWARHDVARACNPARRAHHPVAGELIFELELLDAADGDLQLVLLECLGGADRRRWTEHVLRASGGAPRLHVV